MNINDSDRSFTTNQWEPLGAAIGNDGLANHWWITVLDSVLDSDEMANFLLTVVEDGGEGAEPDWSDVDARMQGLFHGKSRIYAGTRFDGFTPRYEGDEHVTWLAQRFDYRYRDSKGDRQGNKVTRRLRQKIYQPRNIIYPDQEGPRDVTKTVVTL